MRRILVLLVVLALTVPAVAAARKLTPGDGTLVVRSGDGRVWLNDFRGVVLGRIATGTLVLVEPKGGDCDTQLVWEADDQWPRVRTVGDDRVFECVYRTTSGMRFRVVGGQNTLRVNGRGIALTAVGKGTGHLRGTPSLLDDGTYSLDGEDWRSLPDDGRFVRIGSLP